MHIADRCSSFEPLGGPTYILGLEVGFACGHLVNKLRRLPSSIYQSESFDGAIYPTEILFAKLFLLHVDRCAERTVPGHVLSVANAIFPR